MKRYNCFIRVAALTAAVLLLYPTSGCGKNDPILQETLPDISVSVYENSVLHSENETRSSGEAEPDTPSSTVPYSEENTLHPAENALSASDIRLDDFFSYSGKYTEDGSDAAVENIAAVTVTNTGKKAWELIEFDITAANLHYSFTVTALLPGMTLTALESSKKTFPDGKSAENFIIIRSGEYGEKRSKNEDMFKTDIYDGIVNLTNISGRDFTKDIYIYYKNKDQKGYSGGITYRVNMGPLKKDGVSQRSSSHLLKDYSEILFITYGE